MLIRFSPDGSTGGNEDFKAKFEALQKEKEDLTKQLEALKAKPKEDDQSLNDKVKKEKLDKEKADNESKEIEAALRFDLSSETFLNENKEIFQKEIEDIFKAANKEKYNSVIEKANAIKSSILNAFFSLQSNMDILTLNQKQQVDDYFKLTKKAKEEKANDLFVNVFEPSLQMLKAIKKAEQVAKGQSGNIEGSKLENTYKDKLMETSKKHFLRGL